MKVRELTPQQEGRRVQVTYVAPGAVDDSGRLQFETGTIEQVVMSGQECLQAHVQWDTAKPGTLSLAHEDEVMLI